MPLPKPSRMCCTGAAVLFSHALASSVEEQHCVSTILNLLKVFDSWRFAQRCAKKATPKPLTMQQKMMASYVIVSSITVYARNICNPKRMAANNSQRVSLARLFAAAFSTTRSRVDCNATIATGMRKATDTSSRVLPRIIHDPSWKQKEDAGLIGTEAKLEA